ncbi:hypothetical protein T310_9093, partial [Rasamsonia emersonii CBS 393.64]
ALLGSPLWASFEKKKFWIRLQQLQLARYGSTSDWIPGLSARCWEEQRASQVTGSIRSHPRHAFAFSHAGDRVPPGRTGHPSPPQRPAYPHHFENVR